MGELIDIERARRLGELLAGLRGAWPLAARSDPQFRAVKRLAEARGCGEAALLVVANALVSYQLEMRGEDYWTAFAHFFANYGGPDQLMGFSEFLSKYGRRLSEQKLGRLRKFFSSSISREVENRWRSYCGDLRGFASLLARAMGSGPGAKTIAFAAKMLGYLCIACNEPPDFSGIAMPLDYRNKSLLISSCVARSSSDEGELLRAFDAICESADMSCIELDIVIWPIMGELLRNNFDIDLTREKLRKSYGVDVDKELLEELSKCRDNLKNL